MFPIRDHNPSRHVPVVTLGLMAVNIAVYLWGLAVLTDDRATWDFYLDWALFPARLSDLQGMHTLVTSTFLHAGFWHLAGNMLFLWIYGDNMEDEFGRVGFLLFYLAGGIAASLLQWAAEPWSPIPVVGASGAIAAVMGGYLLLFPRARIDILLFLVVYVRTFAVPAFLVLGLWFALQIFGGVNTPTDEGGVAYWAHIGGFAAGLALTVPLWLRLGGPGYWTRTHGHPPHPETAMVESRVPVVRRRR
ncbi:rhomboid family intramembrane serine protease [Wenxinia saemankumensis]|uniref:Membrane associated serine protease, rhomboid family n=1 Tax=Wenxinia saemankumensis TaxID=1447782 RepID=A0A1M6GX31_9RHOB|nr:rhomboid family intramembrane serine protease [Wenxinia saemankumensis]SHJ14521.1 Membrane associated serine protease, rhomboid family [Wenxinia saemankumensis]